MHLVGEEGRQGESLTCLVGSRTVHLDADEPPADPLPLAAEIKAAERAAQMGVIVKGQSVKRGKCGEGLRHGSLGAGRAVADEAAAVAAAPAVDRRRQWPGLDRHVGRDRRAPHIQREERDTSK